MEEQLLSAARIEVSVEGLKHFQTFGYSKTLEGSPKRIATKKMLSQQFHQKIVFLTKK